MNAIDILEGLSFWFTGDEYRCKKHLGPGQYPLSDGQREILSQVKSGDLQNLRPDGLMWWGRNEQDKDRLRTIVHRLLSQFDQRLAQHGYDHGGEAKTAAQTLP